jgi:hypothetical protein
MSDVDTDRFKLLNAKLRKVKGWQGFKVGDLVSCYRCEEGREYMPGVGEIVAIFPDEEYPFSCEHGVDLDDEGQPMVGPHKRKLYTYKASEIDLHDPY